jgi:hypothetical protein
MGWSPPPRSVDTRVYTAWAPWGKRAAQAAGSLVCLHLMCCWLWLMKGWRSWNAWESDVTQTKMDAVLDALTAPRAIWNGSNVSLLQLGFNRVGIDEGWEQCGAGVNGSFNDKNCVPLTSRSRFPDMPSLVKKHHAAGAKLDW